MLKTTGDTGSSLSLALSSRLAVKALMNLQDQAAPDAELKGVLNDVVLSLAAIKSGGPLFARLTSRSNFEDYAQMQTLAEVGSAFADVTRELQTILTSQKKTKKRERSIESAIEFFTALESRALQKYNQDANLGY